MFNEPFFIPAALIALISVPLILGIVPRQWAIGIRTPKTLADDETWLRANRFGGFVLFCACLIYLATAWLVPCVAPCGVNFAQWLVHFAAFALPIFTAMALIRWYLQGL